MKYFWTNTIWFILLGIITVIQVIYIMAKVKNRKLTFTLFLAMSGMAFIIETSLFGIFRSYDYYPMIFHQVSGLDDSLAGNVFSQFSIGATAIMISALSLKYYWALVSALIYGAIEELFLSLGVYKHHWYRTWITVVGFTVIFIILKIIYIKVIDGKAGKKLKFLLVYLAVFSPHTLLFSWPFRLFRVLTFSEHLLPNPIVSGMLFFAINYNVLSIAIILSYFLKLKWRWNGVIILLFYIAYYTAGEFGIIESANKPILILFATLQIFGMYLFAYLFGRLFERTSKTGLRGSVGEVRGEHY